MFWPVLVLKICVIWPFKHCKIETFLSQFCFKQSLWPFLRNHLQFKICHTLIFCLFEIHRRRHSHLISLCLKFLICFKLFFKQILKSRIIFEARSCDTRPEPMESWHEAIGPTELSQGATKTYGVATRCCKSLSKLIVKIRVRIFRGVKFWPH